VIRVIKVLQAQLVIEVKLENKENVENREKPVLADRKVNLVQLDLREFAVSRAFKVLLVFLATMAELDQRVLKDLKVNMVHTVLLVLLVSWASLVLRV
jgi:hypothetical protein